jgi:hypothetical protein
MRLFIQALLVVCTLLAVGASSRAAEPILVLEDRRLLTALEAKGYDFGSLFGRSGAQKLDVLYRDAPAYGAIVDTIASDVAVLRADMKAGGRTLHEVTGGNVGRVIDLRWLKTGAASFRLVGVVNRADRQDFLAMRGGKGCGEVRFVYRLSYSFRKDGQGRTLASRMPFNFNAVYDVAPDADGGCAAATARWTPGDDEAVDAGWLAGGPLDPSELTLRQIELNAQVVRFPSGQETEFGGQAAYLMRIFSLDRDGVHEVPLENTVDAARVAADETLKADLAAYVRGHVAEIDLGVYEVPERFLARKVISYSTFGTARAVNHPFSAIFAGDTFSDVDLGAARLIRTSDGLIRRLDNGSCQGCHQSGSTAGFHLIGLDDEATSPLNRIQVGISPHLHAELPRRAAWLAAAGADRVPDRFRPLSSAPPADWSHADPAHDAAGAGMPCLAGGEARDFAATWQCGAGTVCTPLATASSGRFQLAQCLLPKDSREMFSGHPCVTGEIATNLSQPFNDRMRITGPFAAKAPDISRTAYTCRPPKIGVPGGLAYRACDEADRTFAGFRADRPVPREICGLAGGKKFDLCVATNNFDQCIGGAVVRGNRPSCSADSFCREDYMCQAFPADTPGLRKVRGIGFCSPTYFVFQMRIDNHARPWGKSGAGRSAYRSSEEQGDEDPAE